jgi:hypothetical protein
MQTTQFMPELVDEQDILQALQDAAFQIKEDGYDEPLTPEEIEIRKNDYFINDGKIIALTEERKELVKDITDQIKELKSANDNLRREIREGKVEKKGAVYFIADLEDSMMKVYTKFGVLISSRRLTPEEKRHASQRIPFKPAKVVGQ